MEIRSLLIKDTTKEERENDMRAKKTLTEEQKKLDIDLWIIALVTVAVFVIYGMTGTRLMAFCKDSSVSVWPRLFAAASMQFGIAGLGITIVCILRKKSSRALDSGEKKRSGQYLGPYCALFRISYIFW